MRLGAHVSVSGGYIQALDYAESVGAECIQIFAKSPRQWKARGIEPQLAEAFVAERAARGFGPVFTHTAYLINLATDNEELRAKSVPALADELVRASLLGADGVVCHVGNDPLDNAEAAARRVADSVLEAFELAGDAGLQTRLLLENTAGAGKTFGSTFEQLGACIDDSGLPTERLGVCIDTCHAFAYGMALDTPAGWREVVDGIGSLCGRDRLGLIHANDCMFERGSRRDRHAWIGDGFIGEAGFAAMVCVPELAEVPACVEMAGDVPIKDSTNIERLKALRDQCA
jgi:deoxyribonuclease IV